MSKFEDWRENSWRPSFVEAMNLCENDPDKDLHEVEAMREKLIERSHLSGFYTQLKVWRSFFESIAKQSSEDVAVAAERWVYRNHLSERYRRAMHGWWCIFIRLETLPDLLHPFHEEFFQTVDFRRFTEFSEALYELDEQYVEEHRIVETGNHYFLGVSHDALITTYVGNRVIKILNFLAEQLSQEQIEDFTNWVNEKYVEFKLGNPDVLCSEELITTKTPFSDFPTITKISNLKENIQFNNISKTHFLTLIK